MAAVKTDSYQITVSLDDVKRLLTTGRAVGKKLVPPMPSPRQVLQASRPELSCRTEKGGRLEQEDTNIIGLQVADANGTFYEVVAVFDGHNGAQVAEFLQKELPMYLRRHLATVMDVTELPGALHRAFLEAHADLPEGYSYETGSTAVVALVSRTHIVVASTGDSRAVLVSGGTGIELVPAHNFELPGETERVRASGGEVFCYPLRLNGILNMSRAIGNKELCAYGLIPDPDVRIYERKDGDEYLVITSDGVPVEAEAMPATAVADLVRQYTTCKDAALELSRCKAAVDVDDNTTVIVMDLKVAEGLVATQSELLPDDMVAVKSTAAARLTRRPSCWFRRQPQQQTNPASSCTF
jgi:serine/threonine protein phosphatase PrpC